MTVALAATVTEPASARLGLRASPPSPVLITPAAAAPAKPFETTLEMLRLTGATPAMVLTVRSAPFRSHGAERVGVVVRLSLVAVIAVVFLSTRKPPVTFGVAVPPVLL